MIKICCIVIEQSLFCTWKVVNSSRLITSSSRSSFVHHLQSHLDFRNLSNLARVVHRARCRWSCMSVYEKCPHLAIYIKKKRWVIAHEHFEDKTEKTEKWERYDRVRAAHVDAEEKNRDSFRLDHHRDLTHLLRMRSILIKRRQNEIILNFVIWLIKQAEPAKRKTKQKQKNKKQNQTFSKSNLLRQLASACSERSDASEREEIW
jgi:hypothetical protein